jgi:hypothetical protein
LADFESWRRTTPVQIWRKPRTTVRIWMGEPLKPRKRTAEETIVEDVK